ncbi:GntR family transcriptional regulator [uncultured Arthrobacter sp.]|uniref:GntR family transcriptional regulator n=1 Tax=uncultured Arthrobacter sp. TaxID=114050 RepID=UPI0026046A6D|nr:GntR family transcriptional regulator [uncultured Arthrobacter sp.]
MSTVNSTPSDAPTRDTAPRAVPDRDVSAYGQVRAMIASGELAAGAWLRETTLADRIGVSRTPIREALNRLAAEGLVDLSRNKGAQVVDFSTEDVAGLYDVRSGFEPHAVRLSVPHLTDDDVAELASLSARMEAVVDGGGDMDGLSPLNAAFHGIFIERCGNRHVATALQAVMRPAVVAHTFRKYSEAALRRSMQHHAELVAAADARDGEWAEAVMRTHILAARNAAGDTPSTR